MTVSTVEVLLGFNANSIAYRQVGSADPENATEVLSVIAAGDSFPRFLAANGSTVGIPVETNQVATILTQCGLFGASTSTTTLFYQLVNSLSGRAGHASTVHSKLDAALARMYITNITAGSRQQASARARIVPVSDGTNAPLIRTGSVAVTAVTPTTAENFVLGPISVNGVAIPACNGLDINLNPKEWALHDESFEHTTFAANEGIAPVVSFQTTSPAALALHQTAVSGTNKFRAHLIRKKRNALRFTDAEEQHIRFEIVDGLILVQSVAGSPREYRVEVYASGADADGFSGAPMTATINSAIVL